MIETLREINDKLIEKYKNNPEMFKKHLAIKSIIDMDNAFMQMDMALAYAILKDLQIADSDLKAVYGEIIDI